MARSHGQLLASIWSDPDWLALTGAAQRVYMLLLSQPKLTLVGLLDYLPSRWARLAADTTLDSIEADIDELEASRFVLVDRHTDELLIRTLVKHDITSLAKGTGSSKLIKGLWRAWEGIESRQLRHIAAHEIPEALWASDRVEPPAEAVEMRRSAPIEPPMERAIEPKRARNSPLSTLHSPLASDAVAHSKQPGNSRGPRPAAAAPVDNSVFDQALELLADSEIARNPTRGPSVERHRAGIIRGKRRDHHDAAHQLLAADPSLTPDQLADLLEPPRQPDTTAEDEAQATAERIRAAEAETERRIADQRRRPDDPDPAEAIRAAKAALRRPPDPGDTP